MGFRWIKKISLGGGLRSTISRRGMGWSWGIPGVRFGMSPTGNKYISFGIPGTGFYFVKYFTSKKSVTKDDKTNNVKIKAWKNIK